MNEIPINIFLEMSENDPLATKVLRQMAETTRGKLNILVLNLYNIKGNKIWRLFKDCCREDLDKFDKTISVLLSDEFTDEEIQANLTLPEVSIPFIDEYTLEFYDLSNPDEWHKFLEMNSKTVKPRIHDLMRPKTRGYNKLR